MQTLVERGGGWDVHPATVVACLLIISRNGRVGKQMRAFATTTRELVSLRTWLLSEGCQGSPRLQTSNHGCGPQDPAAIHHMLSQSFLQRSGRSLPRQAQREPSHPQPGSSFGTPRLR